MRTLIFDTETTDLVRFGRPLDEQPHPVQLGCLLKEGRQVYAVVNVIINAGVPIGEKAQEAHGLTESDLESFGVSPATAVDLFLDLVEQADRIVCHNSDFDRTLMAAAIYRLNRPHKDFVKKPHICTMYSSLPICKLPGRYGNYKWPKLIEAYQILVDPAGFEGAHDALADVKACAAVLEKLEELGVELVGGKY